MLFLFSQCLDTYTNHINISITLGSAYSYITLHCYNGWVQWCIGTYLDYLDYLGKQRSFLSFPPSPINSQQQHSQAWELMIYLLDSIGTVHVKL